MEVFRSGSKSTISHKDAAIYSKLYNAKRQSLYSTNFTMSFECCPFYLKLSNKHVDK